MRLPFFSQKAIRHASVGDFKYQKKNPSAKRTLRMKSGGHGQENIAFLKKKKINHKIETEFENGVRLGHIPDHIRKPDRQNNGHAWFPAFWKRKDIKKAGEHVASLKKNKNPMDGQRYTGRYKGVSVGIICRKNKIKTVFPNFDVNKDARKKTNVKTKK